MGARRRNLGTPSPKQEDSMQKSRQTMNYKGRKFKREKQDQTQLNKRYTYKQKQSIPNATTPVPS